MANARRPRVEDNINGFDTYFSIDVDDAALYDGFTNNRTRNAFLSFMRKVIANRRKDLRGRNTGGSIDRLWTARRNHWLGKTDNGRQPAAMAVAPGAVAPALPPAAPPNPAPPVVAVAVPTGLPQPDNNDDASVASSEASSGERSPNFFLQNDPKRKHFLGPTAGQRKDFYSHDDGRWKFAMTLHQTRLEDGKRRFSQGSMPRKSVYLCVRTNSTGVIEDRVTVKCLEAISDKEKKDAEDEIHMNQIISTLNCSHMIPYCGHSHRKSTKTLRTHTGNQVLEGHLYNIYTSFAELGTLARIHDGHKKEERPVPEHFIWYFLSQVTEALLALRDGTCSSPNAAPEDQEETWRAIVHSDIKDANIFLQAANTKYPAYPNIVVSDFDIACEKGTDERRYDGTPGMQPPEREHSALKELDWFPERWTVSEKSDIWSLAMTTWALMVAHNKGTDFYDEADERCKTWVYNDELKKGNVSQKEGIFPRRLSELPKEYSVGLCEVVSECLRYDPDGRPSLEKLRKVIDDQLARLDRMYGDEIKKPEGTIVDDFKLAYTPEESDTWAQFALGQTVEPPRKRRKTDDAGAFKDELAKVINDWKSKSRYPVSGAADRDALSSVDQIINDWKPESIVKFRANLPQLHAWRYLSTCIRKRTSPEAYVYRYDNDNEQDPSETLKRDNKRTVLETLRDVVVPIAKNVARIVASEAAEENGEEATHAEIEGTPNMISLDTLRHAIEWGLVLLNVGVEPRNPRLSEKTEMHRGMLDFLFKEPSGVYDYDPNY
ncbi:uncharacterized protein J4E87_001024 [Alternaria ethzedia]|uniref:uncharacterized protein n=1 Tax=Alternaria ethzedia TaxID=181014 RepID=UPI0020C3AB13|nr:uncharacterized protein J4E87_001024 [Alternaria ethzedia]KAI4633858.1 hypothetical protein J4E87_001024 [Alternaria ethzedia]